MLFDFLKKKRPEKTEIDPRFYYLETSKAKRRLAIGDIHGCPNTFNALLEKIKLEKTDFLFLLGDYIDRGPDSKSVLDTIMQLQADGYNIFPIKGNHEESLHESIELLPYNVLRYHKDQNLESLLDGNGTVAAHYQRFFSELPFCIETEDFFFVHGGFDFEHEKPLEQFDEMLWIRYFTPSPEVLQGKRLIHGHTPVALTKIETSIANRELAINLDNGAVFAEHHDQGLGNLVCLDLDRMELFVQPNVEHSF